MGTDTLVQILAEDVCTSQSINALKKGRNPTILSQGMGK